ncbi:MAG: aminopeptidase P N-terminal domain-containing protein [Akkermansia sp.]|nr:aminopeptidase P N-terminal domain-containing protein [Akkermansia sp.]
MRYEPLPASFYRANRAELASKLPIGSVLVLHSNDVFPTNADGTFALHQNANLFYLTGIDQEESVLIMRIREDGWDETLLLRETNEQIVIWEGARLTQKQAQELSDIQDVRWTSEYDTLLDSYLPKASNLYVEANLHPRSTCPVETRNARMCKQIQSRYPALKVQNVYDILATMRQIKKPEEIVALQKACDITNAGFRELLSFIRPGVGEWQIEGFLSNAFISRGPRKFSFLPIIASGKDTCVLHYIQNDKICQDGDLVLMDIGTEYGNYNSDMTRTVPVNGKFTPRQRAVYEAVRHTMEFAKSILRPGIRKSDYERQIRVHMGKELLTLGLVTEAQLAENPADPPIVRKYFMHGCSHFLGLDVHDVGESDPIIATGMVYTIEPGIYIPEESIGIRLENDVLVGETENTDLLGDVPLHPDDIEALMAR